jgi:hypothetical protein
MMAELLIAWLAPVLAALAAVAPAAGPGAGWPEIREMSLTRDIRFDDGRIDLDVPLRDRSGAIRYRLICRGGSAAYLDRVSERTGTAGYIPDLTCILNAGDRETDSSLLSEDESAAYYSRGHFVSNELLGACAAYPEYGLTRHFRLRGMELRLSVSNLTVGPGARRPADARLSVSVRRDPSARTAKAEQPGYLRPDGTQSSCHIVRRGNTPRMCRSPETSSWAPCTPEWVDRRYSWETAQH